VVSDLKDPVKMNENSKAIFSFFEYLRIGIFVVDGDKKDTQIWHNEAKNTVHRLKNYGVSTSTLLFSY